MPQMMPLNWLSLFIFFISMFLLFNNLNYFNFSYLTKMSNINKYTMKLSWKW